MCVQANEDLQNVIDSYDQQFHDRELDALRLAEHRNEELEARQSLWNTWFLLHVDKATCCSDCKKRKAEAMEEGQHIARELRTQPAERSG